MPGRKMPSEKRSLTGARKLIADCTLDAKNATSFDWMFEVDVCTDFMTWISNTVVTENVLTDDELVEYNAGLAERVATTADDHEDELCEDEDIITEEIGLIEKETEHKKTLVQHVKASSKKIRSELCILEKEQNEQESQLADDNLINAKSQCLKAAQEFDKSNRQIYECFTRVAADLMETNKRLLVHMTFQEFKDQSSECKARVLQVMKSLQDLSTESPTEILKPDVIGDLIREDPTLYIRGINFAALKSHLLDLDILNKNLSHIKVKEFLVSSEEASISTASKYLTDLLNSIQKDNLKCDPITMETELSTMKEKLIESDELYKVSMARYLSCISESHSSKSAILDECSIKRKREEYYNDVAQTLTDCISSQYRLGLVIYLLCQDENCRIEVAMKLWNNIALANVDSEHFAAHKGIEAAAISADRCGDLAELFHLPAGSSFRTFVAAALRLDSDIAGQQRLLVTDNIEMALRRITRQRKAVEKLKRFVLSGPTMQPEYIDSTQAMKLYKCEQELHKMQNDLKILIAKSNVISQESKGDIASLKQNLWVLFLTDGGKLEVMVRNSFRKYK